LQLLGFSLKKRLTINPKHIIIFKRLSLWGGWSVRKNADFTGRNAMKREIANP